MTPQALLSSQMPLRFRYGSHFELGVICLHTSMKLMDRKMAKRKQAGSAAKLTLAKIKQARAKKMDLLRRALTKQPKEKFGTSDSARFGIEVRC
jgi:hypothetical protein